MKFIRFAQWRIEQTGYGVLAFVTNHGYLDNPTFRGMRQSLMQSFDDIYLLDLHGNSKKKEKAPDGGKDENVFDIQQGVAIGLFVKRSKQQEKPAQVYHADLFGTRESKYIGLAENDLTTTHWQTLQPQAPHYLFVPQDIILLPEYDRGWKITEVMPVNSVGLYTARDKLLIHYSPVETHATLQDFALINAETAREKYDLGPDSRDWQVALAQKDLSNPSFDSGRIRPILYRPFDVRFTYYTGISRGIICMPRPEIMNHMLAGNNLGLITNRQVNGNFYHVLCSTLITNDCTVSSGTKERSYLFPLYLYPTAKTDLFSNDNPSTAPGGRRPNLAPEFIADFSARLQLDFVPDGCGDLRKTFGPEDVFHYAYAVFHSPTYRSRYAEFLKIDFPRLPITRDVELLRSLCVLGKELVALHLMEQLPKPQTRYPIAGDNTVDNVRYTDPAADALGRVWINKTQYFDNVPPEVWSYHIGGYQVCQKWLKDRKGRQLSYDDLTHYQGIVAALARTIELQAAIDGAIGEWPFQ